MALADGVPASLPPVGASDESTSKVNEADEVHLYADAATELGISGTRVIPSAGPDHGADPRTDLALQPDALAVPPGAGVGLDAGARRRDAVSEPSPDYPTRSADPRSPVLHGQDPGISALASEVSRRGQLRYQIMAEHGRGGLGRVSRAHDRELGRDVAIKELIHRSDIGEARFLREALITARLEHPGIVPVHEAGRWPDGTPFYAMKLVAGRPLRDLIAERHTVNERIALLHHVIVVADAIAYAHGRNIIHRDLKPGNVIVGDFGETVVIDWGLAKDLSTSDERGVSADSLRTSPDDDLTNTGSILGTPAYMAPEQEQGQDVDQRADVFAIGAMLWELCALQKVPPIEPRLRHRILRRGGIDRDLVTIIDKALARAPADRYADASALAADLKAFKAGARIAARNYSLPALLAHWTRHHRALALSVVIVLTVGAIATTLYIQNLRAERDLTRNALKAELSQQVAEVTMTQAELERGRQALLHGEPEAQDHLGEAYRRDPAPSTAFMFARSLQPRLQEQARLQSTFERMWSATFSPNGNQLVTTDDKNAQIWDARTYRLMFTLPHGDTVYQAVYSGDGTRLVTGAGDGAVRIWNTSDGKLIHELRHGNTHTRYYVITLSADGKFVAGADREVARVWDANTGKQMADLHDKESDFPSLAFSSDHRWLAVSGGSDVHVFDTRTWLRARTIPGPANRGLSWAPNALHLLTGTAQGDVSIWAIPSGERVHHLRDIGESIDAVAYSADGQLVVAASHDGAEQVWDASGKLRSQGNWLHGKIFSVEFDRASRLVVAAGASGSVIVSDALEGMPVAVLDGPSNVVKVAHFDPQGRRVVGASWDGTARIWDATAPYLRWRSAPVNDECGLITSLEPDRRFVAVGCIDHPTRIWDTAHDHLLAELPSVSQVDGDFASAFPAVSATGDLAAIARGTMVDVYGLPSRRLLQTIRHGAAVNAVAFASTGRDLITGAIDGSLLVTSTDADQRPLPTLPDGVDAVGFLPDGRVVAAAGKRLRIYDPVRGLILKDLKLDERVRTLRMSADGRHLVTVPSFMGKAASPELWDIESYQRVALLQAQGQAYSARFLANGQILTACSDGAARRWDGETGKLQQTYHGGSRYLIDGTLTPDGSMLIAGGDDGLLRFWDAASGRPLWAMLAHNSRLVGVHVEGEDIVTRSFSGEISRWHLPASERVIEACHARDTCNIVSK